ncbi:TetR/AcrR family transcriptional regulator [Nocardia aurantia]|nr:TetR/AcrR family transcriptional regulator [Nocardia aurantia]
MATGRQVKHGAGRDALLDATLRLIGKRGMFGFTMRDIASEAGMALGSTTYHFADRDELLRAALQRFADEEIGRIHNLLDRLADADPEAVLTAVIDELRRTNARPGATVAQLELYLAASRDPLIAESAARCVTAYHALAQRALTAVGVPPGRAADLARWVVALIDGFAVHAAAAGDATAIAADLPDALRALIDPTSTLT